MSYQYHIPDCHKNSRQSGARQPSRQQAKDLSGKPLHKPLTENDAVLPLMHPLLCDAVKAYKRMRGIDVFKDLSLPQQRECEMLIMQGKIVSARLNDFYAKIFKAAEKKEKARQYEDVCSFDDLIKIVKAGEN